MRLSIAHRLGNMQGAAANRFSPAATDYFTRLGALRVTTYDKANAALIDRLVGNGGNLWPASGAFCAMAGYLYPGNGANLIPLKDGHDAGTLNAFVTGNWNAVTGLVGVPASSTYVDTNRAQDDDARDNQAVGFYASSLQPTGTHAFFGAGIAGGQTRWANNSSTFSQSVNFETKAAAVGYNCISRVASANFRVWAGGTTELLTRPSTAPKAEPMFIFCRASSGVAGIFTASRFQFYNQGPGLTADELAELDAALTEWKNALAAL